MERLIYRNKANMNSEFYRKEPSDILAPYIEYLWYLNHPLLNNELVKDRFVPNGKFEFIIDLKESARHKLSAEDWTQRPKSFVVGLLEKSILVKPNDKIEAIGAVFKHGKGRYFINMPMQYVSKMNVIPLTYLYGRKADDLENRVLNEDGELNKLEVLERFLEDNLNREYEGIAFVDYAIKSILDNKGDVNISDIAKTINCSERHLSRKFNETVGFSPKKFSKIIKINHVVKDLNNRDMSLMDIAVSHGYFDQPHFNRVFKEIVGVTPTQYLKEANEFRDYFND